MCLGGSSANTDRKTQLENTGKAQNIGDLLTKFGGDLVSSGKKDTKAGLDDTDKASTYYSNILSGDPTKVLAAVAPEVKSITGQADQAKKAIAQGGNRSGGSNADALSIDDKSRGSVADTIAKARPAAAAGIERTGAQKSGVGISESGQGVSATSGAGSIFQQLVNSSIGSRGQSQKIHDDAVQQWADVVSTVLFGA